MKNVLEASISVGALLALIVDMVLASAPYIVACYIILPVDATTYLLHYGGLVQIAAVALVIVIALYFVIPRHSPVGPKQLAHGVCIVIGIAFLTEGVAGYASRSLRLPARVMLLGSLLAGVVLYCERLAVGVISQRGAIMQRQPR